MDCFVDATAETLAQKIESGDLTIIFKHSTRCSISGVVLNRVKSFCSTTDLAERVYLVKVIEQRDLSNKLAERLAVKHESPQLIVAKGDQVLRHMSHFDINESSLTQAINEI